MNKKDCNCCLCWCCENNKNDWNWGCEKEPKKCCCEREKEFKKCGCNQEKDFSKCCCEKDFQKYDCSHNNYDFGFSNQCQNENYCECKNSNYGYNKYDQKNFGWY